MRCNHCHSPMQQTDAIAEGSVRQVWYQCQVCGCHHVQTQPCEATFRRLGNGHRCSSGFPIQNQLRAGLG